jgi:hypothetical protein
MAYRHGDPALGRSLFEESLAILWEVGDKQTIVHALGGQGHLALEVGDYGRASTLYKESLTMRRKMGDVFLVAQSLEDFAALAWRQGQHERAARLLGASEARCQTLNITLPTADLGEYTCTLDTARAALGEETFVVAWAEGRAMTLEKAIEYALERNPSE